MKLDPETKRLDPETKRIILDPETTRIVVVIFAVAFAIIAIFGFIFYVYELYLGAVSPTAFFAFVAIILYGGGSFAQSYFNRIHAAKDAATTQAAIVDTQIKVSESLDKTNQAVHILTNGLSRNTADMVKADSAQVATALAENQPLTVAVEATATNTAKIAENTAKESPKSDHQL